MSMKASLRRSVTATALLLGTSLSTTAAQTQRDEQFYYPGDFNWQFLAKYPEAARLFNAFDYGHAVLYERLYTKRGKASRELETEYRYLTTDLLVRPPRVCGCGRGSDAIVCQARLAGEDDVRLGSRPPPPDL